MTRCSLSSSASCSASSIVSIGAWLFRTRRKVLFRQSASYSFFLEYPWCELAADLNYFLSSAPLSKVQVFDWGDAKFSSGAHAGMTPAGMEPSNLAFEISPIVERLYSHARPLSG